MKYQVPQFIEVEDRIFGPLTLKQFLYVAGGAAIGFLLWSSPLPRFLAILIGVPLVGFFMALAFYQMNGRPFVNTVESAVKYFFASKLYIWKREQKKIQNTSTADQKEKEELYIPKLSDSKLKELTWSLDINEKLNK